jgi:tetratricopeptide (TPR) repeat protein
MKHLRLALPLCILSFALHACSTGVVPGAVRARVETDPATALGELEALAQQHPHDFEVRMLIGQSHYKLARKALDQKDEPAYLRHVERATATFVDAAAMRPADASPHIFLAMIDAYQADMKGALRSLRKAQQLAPGNPISYTNLAQIYIYLDQVNRAETMLDRARDLGGPGPHVEMNEMLAAWKRGDMVDARDLFDVIHGENPEFLQTWDEAPVSGPMESFDDFVAYCCGNPSCGPYMRGPCEKARQEVAEREVTLETLRREQEIARESREKLRRVYTGEREVTIEAEEEAGPTQTPAK